GWGRSTGKELRRWSPSVPPGESRRNTRVQCLAVSPDGTLLAAGEREGFLHLWDLADGTLIRSWQAHKRPTQALLRGQVNSTNGGVVHVAFSPDGERVSTAGYDKKVNLRHAATGPEG